MNAPRYLVTISLLALLAATPAWAQEEESEEPADAEQGGKGTIYAEFGSWVAQPVGLDYTPASRINFNDPLDTELLDMKHGTENRNRVRFGYDFGNTLGEFMITWYSHETQATLSESTPSVFQFGEALAEPLGSGFAEDGLADAFIADTDTKIRDFRLDYYRPAFSNPRASAKWFVGVRRFFHRRTQNVAYFALVPELPVLLPPVVSSSRDDLDPLPDAVRLFSEYNGRGAEAGMDFTVPLWKERVVLEAGVLLAVLRGTVDARYESVTYLYALLDQGQIVEILDPPYDNWLDPDPNSPGNPLVNRIQQIAVPTGVRGEGVSMTSQVLETHIGFRWWIWKGLQLLGGFRNAHFDEVGLELRPGASLDQPVRTFRSVGYEGYYAALAYTY